MSRLALAQINTVVGDIEGNARKVRRLIADAGRADADLIAFPELTLTGYPPEDLLYKPNFIHDNLEALKTLAAETGGLKAVVGFAEPADNGRLFNSAALLGEGKIIGVYRKTFLPNYGVFDEVRYFSPGSEHPVFNASGVVIGLTVCQDIWEEKGPACLEAAAGAKLIINISASPYHIGKGRERESMLRDRAAETGAFLAYVNLVGGQDELVFDGGSLVVSPDGAVITRGRQFEEELIVVDIDTDSRAGEAVSPPASSLGRTAEVYSALVLGVRDYVRKNGFKTAVLGLSGGVDSALAAAIAVDALGPENVKTVFMPARFTSAESREDAVETAALVGTELTEINIDDIFEAYLKALRPQFGTLPFDTSEENIQARVRGNILMGLANKFGWIVLATGNKSELAVGYATLYGDMAGGFEVVKDIPKTMVYELAAYRNERGPAIPEDVMKKTPTAELKPDQKDTDSLPPYEVLDPIINAYVEQNMNAEEIAQQGYDPKIVRA
ncbi:MAG: NAD+ synthase, partial [Actinomycetota bacterium]